MKIVISETEFEDVASAVLRGLNMAASDMIPRQVIPCELIAGLALEAIGIEVASDSAYEVS